MEECAERSRDLGLGELHSIPAALGLRVTPNPSFELTATGKPASAAQFKRQAPTFKHQSFSVPHRR